MVMFTKAFDSMHRPSLWRILKKYGFPSDIIDIIHSLYDQGQSTVKWSGTIGEWFKVTTGVHLITRAIRPCHRLGRENSTNRSGCWLAVDTTDGNRLSDLGYADDIVLLETSRDRMQQSTESVETKVLHF